ncbi:CRACD-like protein isoform X2 [Danio aesculapii]|uniref:CRACD-like protein isoform X2 n=1 Tax=Danio aesculapii TaxID=1142201 RepID=UPI0024BF633E|nr:CRACD-like protein isoform X2 [Danio aesculapii]
MARFYSCFGNKNDCDIMASGSPDVTATNEPSEAAEECSGKKKSKFQTFKNFFVKKKRKESLSPSSESGLKASQSSDDVNASEQSISHVNSDNDPGSKINLGNKAMSHDSVFVSDSPSSETNEGLGTSQDSIHGKVKSLQLQLKQAIRLGSPPALLCGRKAEDAGALSEDDGLPCSPPEYSSLHTVLATPVHTSVDLTQSSLSMEASDSEDDQMSYDASSRPSTPQASVPVDFSLPASSVSCLDSSAARHRIAVKANARAKRKPASRQMLDKRRDLREKLLLRDTEDKLRMVTSIEEHECEDLPGEQVSVSDHESFASEHEDEEMTDSGQFQKTSPTSSISAGDDTEGEERDHVPESEVPQSSWEIPVTLELQADDFLLDTGCEVVPEEQGSLLEEVLSSLKSPLASGLTLEHENISLQSEVEDTNSESIAAQLEEEDIKDLLIPSEPVVTINEQAPPPDSLSESSVDSGEISEETTEEELLEFTGEESVEPSHSQVPEEDKGKQVDKAESAREDEELVESPVAFIVNVKESDVTEDEAELEMQDGGVDGEDVDNRDSGNDGDGGDDEDDKLTKVEPEKSEDSINDVEPQEDELSSPEPENHEASDDERDLVVLNVENVPESDHTDRDDVWRSTQTSDEPEASDSSPVEVLVSPQQESPILQAQFSNSSMSSLEKEEDPKPNKLEESGEPQGMSSEEAEVVVSEQQVLELPVSIAEVRPRFTITPAWQRSLASPESQTEDTNVPAPQITQLIVPILEDRPKPARTQSSPTLPVQKEVVPVEEEKNPENPFGVRLRKTPVLHRYGLDGEASRTSAQTVESAGAQETPDQEQNDRKPVLLKKPELMFDTGMSARKVPETVGRISVGSSESPSWISVARQKQRNFMENSSPENSPEKVPSQVQGEVGRQDSSPSLSAPVVKEQLTQPCSPLQVFCSLELSNTSMVEKESKRISNPSTAPLAQDEPPWLALAKKKAKAWSEMPQIVQ